MLSLSPLSGRGVCELPPGKTSPRSVPVSIVERGALEEKTGRRGGYLLVPEYPTYSTSTERGERLWEPVEDDGAAIVAVLLELGI